MPGMLAYTSCGLRFAVVGSSIAECSLLQTAGGVGGGSTAERPRRAHGSGSNVSRPGTDSWARRPGPVSWRGGGGAAASAREDWCLRVVVRRNFAAREVEPRGEVAVPLELDCKLGSEGGLLHLRRRRLLLQA